MSSAQSRFVSVDYAAQKTCGIRLKPAPRRVLRFRMVGRASAWLQPGFSRLQPAKARHGRMRSKQSVKPSVESRFADESHHTVPLHLF
jgi:hypothetical protein